jgi:cellulose synthase/poly-beta-1,6-N-acetylglucosamine synthase-like glycosyltransferase
MKNSVENNLPFVSVVIPCRNEEGFIKKCLDSILAQDFPKERMEILVADGMSQDATRQIIQNSYSTYPFIKILDNPDRITPAAFNVGIKASKGEIVLIMGAHSTYQNDYISKCVHSLIESDADNVGGICKILPRNDGIQAKSIAYALYSAFGMGNSYFRVGSEKNRYVDTVFGGCYRKKLFDKIGLFDVDLIRGQDTEFNTRIINNGGKILLVPEIVSYYSARDTLLNLGKMQWQYGHFKPLVIKKVGKLFTLRQVVAPLFVSVLALSLILSLFVKPFLFLFFGVLGSYIIANLAFSFKIASKECLKCFPIMPIVFAVIHFAWGTAFLKGILDFLILNKDRKRDLKDIPLTR